MQVVKRQVSEWLKVLNNRDHFAEILFSCEEIYRHFEEYSETDIRYILDNLVEILIDLMMSNDTPDEIILSVASILTKMRPYIKDDRLRQRIFINGSGIVTRYLKSYKKAKVIGDLMSSYRPEN